MTDKLIIRPEQTGDIEQINDVIASAFDASPHGNHNEHLLVSDLRANNALVLALVAEMNQHIVGHIAFSEVLINDEHQSWYGLAPVSVVPKQQNQGIGAALITEGLDQLKSMSANGCVLVGEPRFYNRFRFQQHDQLYYDGAPKEYFLVKSFVKEPPAGKVTYHNIFSTYS